MSDPTEIPGGRPPVLMTGREPPRPWRPPVAAAPLVPEAPRDAQSQAFEDNRRIAVRGLAGGTRLLESVAQGLVGGGLAGGATAGAAVRKAVTDEQRGLGAAERSWLEPLRALTESVAAPLEAQRRQAGLAEIVGALQAQKAVLAKLAGMGAPLPALQAAVRGQLDQLYGRGLMAGERAAVESAWLEELTAEKERGRQARETERQTAQQERLLGGLLSGAVSGVARGQAPDETQAAALEEAQPGLGAAAAEEGLAWAARQDAILGLVARTPMLRRLRSLGGEGAEGLYRRLLVSEQRRAGVPEGELRIWDRAESDAAVAAWVGLAPSGAQPEARAVGLVGYARERLAGLPAALRPLAVAELRRRGLAAGDAAALTAIAEALAAGRDIAAQGLAHRWAAGEAMAEGVQGSIRHASGRRQSLPRGIQGFEGEERESPEPAPEEAPDTAEPATPPASDRDGRLAAYVVLTPEEQRRVEGWTEGLRNGSVTLSGDELLLVMKAVMQRKRVSEDGSLTPEDARLLIAAYDAAQPDPAFLAVQETQRQALRALLIDDERVLDLERNWTRYTREQPEVFQATIIHMAGLVSQAFGIAEPPRVVFEELDGDPDTLLMLAQGLPPDAIALHFNWFDWEDDVKAADYDRYPLVLELSAPRNPETQEAALKASPLLRAERVAGTPAPPPGYWEAAESKRRTRMRRS